MSLSSLAYKIVLVLVGLVAGLLALGWLGITLLSVVFTPALPSTSALVESQLNVPLRIYSADGVLMGEFGSERRAPLKYDEVPQRLVQAFLAAEDDRFFEHPGFDYQGLLRAGVNLLLTGQKSQGGSTITMQLARNYFLGRERTYVRKIKEIMLAMKIEREFDKQQILELYLNKIYLGHHAYGVGAAAQIYYGKEVGQLSLGQMAMIAGLPKAPSRFNPVANPQRALERRNYVLRRMRSLGFITREEYESALAEAVSAQVKLKAAQTLDAEYVTEMVRAEMVGRYGEAAYTGGYIVTTTIHAPRQEAANRALRQALLDYDRRHGYRGPEGRLEAEELEAADQLDAVLARYRSVAGLLPAVVLEAGDRPRVHVRGKGLVRLGPEALGWAGPGAARRLKRGHVVRVVAGADEASPWRLAQWPRVQGALVAMDPRDGAVEALVGGFDFQSSKFNRAVQAQRQPGSAFKPLLYAAALEKGYTPASIINDAPIVFDVPGMDKEWRPENYTGKFYGPTRLREALVHSRNLVTIRLLMAIGIDYGRDFILRFGLPPARVPRNLSMSLGSGTLTPVELARAYAVFANGGYLVQPYYIREIRRADNQGVYAAGPKRVCHDCSEPPELPLVASPQTVFLMTSMLQDVVLRGTAAAAKALGRSDLAGKTGTTNDHRDAWFAGYNAELVTTCWVGFDNLDPLGREETGGRAALPMWMDFMGTVLKDAPESQVPRPNGLVTVRISPATGQLAGSTSGDAIFETFPEDRVPSAGGFGDAQNPSPASGGGRVEELF